jgi:hypothetical protein
MASAETAAAAGVPHPISERRNVTLKGVSEPVEVVSIAWS